jgi:Ca-activated chloride channel family protein
MRPAPLLACGLPLIALALMAATASAQPKTVDKSDSPYFFVPNADPGVDTLPLKETRADVAISGVMAHVKVTQVYKNEGTKPIEAIYIFPGSTRAAVFAMRMTVGDRTIVAEIQKKDDARKIYEDAKAAGKTASLLEQQRPNVFQMNVANVLPGDTIRVEMDYVEALQAEDGSYEFVYPAVVGPRYTGESTQAEGFTETPYTKEGEKPTYGWDVSVRLNGGMKIQRVTSTSHPISTTFPGEDIADITLSNKGAAGTKDFVLKYQLSGKAVQTGVLLLPGDKENFFLAMVQPPERVAPADRPRREYVFIVDVSGSMHGFPIETAKTVMNGLLEGMGPDDTFNILCFSGGNLVLSPESLPVTPANVSRAKEFMANMRGGGGTEILGALREALAMKTVKGFARTFVAVTDGYVSVEPQVFRTIRENLGEASFFAFGIGSSVNRHLIEGMARMGMGEPLIVMHGDDAVEKAARFKAYIESPVLTDIKVDFEGFDAYDVEPVAVADLYAQRPVMVFGKYKGQAKGKITVKGVTGKGAYSQTLDVGKVAPSKHNEALRYLWARHKIATLADYQQYERGSELEKEITQLGLDYNLMTAYTSFVAVDERVRNTNGSTTVKQPLPLPEGVSNLAVAEPAAAPMGAAPPRPTAQAYGQGAIGVRSKAARGDDDMGKLELSVKGGSAGGAKDLELAKPDPRPARVLITKVEVVSGPRTQADVHRAIQALRNQLTRCIGDSDLKPGHAVIELTLDKDGKVIASKVTSAPTAEGGRCLNKPLQMVRLPRLGEGQTGITVVRVTLSIVA